MGWSARWFSSFRIRRKGRLVGKDVAGNEYYEKEKKRWVIYAQGHGDPASVCPPWHGWLHRSLAEPPEAFGDSSYCGNKTGTQRAHRPPHVPFGEKASSPLNPTPSYVPFTPANTKR